jgi:hypothetical protein
VLKQTNTERTPNEKITSSSNERTNERTYGRTKDQSVEEVFLAKTREKVPVSFTIKNREFHIEKTKT